MPDISLNPITPIANGTTVSATNPLPVALVSAPGIGIPFSEIADPAAPAANNAVLYVRDDGGGKSQLVVRFATGVVQVIATEP